MLVMAMVAFTTASDRRHSFGPAKLSRTFSAIQLRATRRRPQPLGAEYAAGITEVLGRDETGRD